MDKIRIARIVNTFGIKGELKVLAETDFPVQRFAKGQTVYLINQENQLAAKIETARLHKGSYIVKFQGIEQINDVESYKGGWLAINAGQQEDLAEDAYYYHQIIGLEVLTTEGEKIGKIKDILALGSNDVWVVQRKQAKDVLIPYIDDVVKEVNLENSTVAIELMEGLMDDED